MSRTTKRFLSVLLAAAMILSLGITGWALDDEIKIVEPEESAVVTDKNVTDAFDGGTELELKEIDPSTLGISRLGEIEAEDAVIEAEELPFDLDDIVRVSIVLDAPATMAAGYAVKNIAANGSAMAYRQTLRNQQAAVEAAIAAAGVSINVKWNLTLAVNIISAEVRYGDIKTIESIEGVKDVWFETQYEPQADEINTAVTTEYMVGAAELWAQGYTGAGSRVAIVDTGTNPDHISFDPEALEYALAEDGGDYNLLTWEEISSVAAELNAPVTEQVYRNAKIPYGYSYIDHDYIIDHSNVGGDGREHGSHVAGISAANRYIKDGDGFVNAAENVYAVGVAPDAQILTMKVFGRGGGAYDSDYMSAIEDAIILNADSVNLSLGSGNPGMSFSNGYQDVMDSLINSGTVVSISAGNAYNWADFLPSGLPYLYLEDVSLDTVGSPGSFINSLTVAAAENVGSATTPLTFNGNQKVLFTETSGYGNAPMASIPGEYDYVLLDNVGVVFDDDDVLVQDYFAELGRDVFEGKVALCYRGTSSFFQKANAALGMGAVAVIIINNQAGVINMNLSGYNYTAPVVSILQADGAEIKANSTPIDDGDGNILYYTGKVSVTDVTSIEIGTAREDANITDFSSWGVPGSLTLKPEITAPGGSIFSVDGNTVDGYEYMSGTSMAAPHVAGMAALLGQYIRENNLEEITGQNRRTLINSLLMSTASPMIVDGAYLPVLQQGAGLGDTAAAMNAKSFILMDRSATSGAADGKVKVELGQDAERVGSYSFSFTVNNFSDVDLSYKLDTALFTQAPTIYQGNLYMLTDTMELEVGVDAYVSYDYPINIPNEHDVNKDGKTDAADAQAILDSLTGVIDAETIDAAAADLDGDEAVSSYDAQLLLKWLDKLSELIVPAGESVPVTVYFELDPYVKSFIDMYYANGGYIEGFTYLNPTTATPDGELLDSVHSIPILGFYGCWTDPSMFDNSTATDVLYGSTKVSYTGNPLTNYMLYDFGEGSTIFTGNPYAVERRFPGSRLAVNSNTKLLSIKYNLIRNAATTGVLAFDSDLNILKNSLGGSQNGAYYYVNGGTWQLTNTSTAQLNTSAAALGLSEGEAFTIGFFAVPEYYGMLLHPGENVNTVTADEIVDLLYSGELGLGSMVGYTLTVDDTAPSDISAVLSDDGTKITVSATDNNYIAYIGLLDLSGNVQYAYTVPNQRDPGEPVEVTFDITGLELPNGVAIFVGDYAVNETAALVVLDPTQPVTTTETIYRLVDAPELGGNYLIANAPEGTVTILGSVGTDAFTTVGTAEVKEDADGPYISGEDADDSFVWNVYDEYAFQNVADGGYLGYYDWWYPYANWSADYNADVFIYDPEARTLVIDEDGGGLNFDPAYPNYFYYDVATPVYFFEKSLIEVEIDPYTATNVVVTPEQSRLVLGANDTVKLLASVEPIIVPDPSVTWSSGDETVATVDQNGLVTAVGAGEAIIYAESNQTPGVVGSAFVEVVAPEGMDAIVYGQVAFSDSNVGFGPIDLNDMSFEDVSGGQIFSYFYGGGVSGDYLVGNDTDDDFHRYNVDTFEYDGDFYFNAGAYAILDAAAFPAFTYYDYTNDEPAVVEYPYLYNGIDADSWWTFWDIEHSATYFNLSSLGTYIAVSFAGVSFEEDGLVNLYYLLLKDTGEIELWTVYPTLDNGGMSARYGTLCIINQMPIDEANLQAYSLSYYETEDDFGAFIADSTNGAIYYINFNEIDDSTRETDAHFLGVVNGAISVSSLSDMYYDRGVLGDLTIGTEAVTVLPESKVSAFINSVNVSGTMKAEELVLSEAVEVPADDADDIVIVGGLDAVRTQPSRPVIELTSAELLNPETYNDQDLVVIDLTTPDNDQLYYNGLITTEYDPSALTYSGVTYNANVTLTSFNVDEEEGLITFAYASLEPISGSVATLEFKAPKADTEVTVTTVEANDNLNVEDVTVIELTAAGFAITVVDYTKEKAVCSLNDEFLYNGETEFTVEADIAVLVLLTTEEGYEILPCTETDESHSFTVNVEAETEITLVFKGDANLDGNVNMRDNMSIKRHTAGTETLEGVALLAANANGDSNVNMRDGLAIKKQTAGTEFIAW